MLANSERPILKAAAVIARDHHEKWDGSGYPEGRRGEEIDIMGRITAVADVFDALGSDRCYKKAWPLDDVLDLFRRESGKHFDPKLVDILFDNLDTIKEIQQRYSD
jgi:response regulator RpfG family c-di-GMP phosphodiesterase